MMKEGRRNGYLCQIGGLFRTRADHGWRARREDLDATLKSII